MSGKRKLVSGSARNDALQALLAAKEKGVKNQFDVLFFILGVIRRDTLSLT